MEEKEEEKEGEEGEDRKRIRGGRGRTSVIGRRGKGASQVKCIMARM